ncbi:SCO family protein [Albidovulum sp.]|uniref:SCO family protein n=1 Tax=Albidovulum sp. TaxID=1872424 RepID=UPI0039B855CF
MPVSTRTYAIAAASVAVIGLVAIYAISMNDTGDRFAPCRGSAVGGGGSIGGPFTLTDENDKRVTEKDVLTGPSLVYFGYTFCPDICPTDTARNAEAVDALEEMGYEVTPVFISVDPSRDTPEVLKEWTDYIHPRMIGLTGTPEEIATVAREYRTYYKVPENPTDDLYTVDHMTQTYLMLPQYGFVDFFTREATPEEIAERTACFIDAARK